jgi:3'(2'), 5'-bisphosphate nucleotidase
VSFTRELETARKVAVEAAALVRTFQGRPMVVERKPGDEPVTEADRAASRLIIERLGAAFPDDAVLSEEVPDDGERFRKSRVWMVDPIDGTRDFIRGDIGFAVMIGLCVRGRPQVGVVVHPPTGVVYGGVVGQVGWKEQPDGTRTPLRTSARQGPPGIRLVASKSHRTDDVDLFRRALAIEDELNVGSVGIKVALVAEGSRDLYIYPGARTKIWDTCAPEAILLSAGGRLTDLEGRELSYTEESLANRGGLVATNGPLHSLTLHTIASVRPPGSGG